MFQLAGKRALITGASGGIGAAIAKALHTQGAVVGLSGTRQEALETLAKSLGERAMCFPARLDTPEGPSQLVQEAEKGLGGLDIVINNAGLTKDGLLMRMKDEDWDMVLAVNLTACFKICREAIRNMLRQRQGRIVNITSIVGVSGNPGQTNYVASKAGLIGFSKALAAEVASRGVTVNCIAPGFIDTAMTHALPSSHHEKLLSNIPLGRMGSPEDIAAGAVYFSSEEAAYVTGQTLHINGGMLMI